MRYGGMYASPPPSLSPLSKCQLKQNLALCKQGPIYWGGKLPPKSFTEKKLQLFQIKIFFDDDFKESVKVTNVQKCDFSQS